MYRYARGLGRVYQHESAIDSACVSLRSVVEQSVKSWQRRMLAIVLRQYVAVMMGSASRSGYPS